MGRSIPAASTNSSVAALAADTISRAANLRRAHIHSGVADNGISAVHAAEFVHCVDEPDVARFRPNGGENGTAMAPNNNSIESSDHLLSYLEHRTGRNLRSREAIDEYVATVGASPSGASASLRDPSLRITAGLGVLALMFLFYYFMDVGLQISSLHSAVLTPATISSPLDHRQDRGERAQSTGEAAVFA